MRALTRLIDDARKEGFLHTLHACDYKPNRFFNYWTGKKPPHFPVPAPIIRVGYMPESPEQDYPSAYWYVASRKMLWSIFHKWGLVVERG